MKYRHSLIKVKTLDPVDNRRQFKGRLLGVSESRIELEVEGKVFQIPFSNVAKANLEVDSDLLRKEQAMK
jgi:ribosome maturation factor RimP